MADHAALSHVAQPAKALGGHCVFDAFARPHPHPSLSVPLQVEHRHRRPLWNLNGTAVFVDSDEND
jgi:hypothetical protein